MCRYSVVRIPNWNAYRYTPRHPPGPFSLTLKSSNPNILKS